MVRLLKRTVLVLVFVFALLGVYASQAQTIQATTLTQISPSSCPASGCAAGQTIDLSRYSMICQDSIQPLAPNVLVCLYTPHKLGSPILPHRLNRRRDRCQLSSRYDQLPSAPDGFDLLGGASAQISASSFGDLLNLGFRIDRTATTSGSALLRVFQQIAGSGWVQSDQSFASIGVMAANSAVFAANDAAACGGFSPCYLNSGGDSVGGFGTGLKDAIDAQPGSITVLGSYAIKSNTGGRG